MSDDDILSLSLIIDRVPGGRQLFERLVAERDALRAEAEREDARRQRDAAGLRAEIERLRAERDRMLAVVVAQAEAWDAALDKPGGSLRVFTDRGWLAATEATEKLAVAMRGDTVTEDAPRVPDAPGWWWWYGIRRWEPVEVDLIPSGLVMLMPSGPIPVDRVSARDWGGRCVPPKERR